MLYFLQRDSIILKGTYISPQKVNIPILKAPSLPAAVLQQRAQVSSWSSHSPTKICFHHPFSFPVTIKYIMHKLALSQFNCTNTQLILFPLLVQLHSVLTLPVAFYSLLAFPFTPFSSRTWSLFHQSILLAFTSVHHSYAQRGACMHAHFTRSQPLCLNTHPSSLLYARQSTEREYDIV